MCERSLSVSLVLPAYNEEKRLGPALDTLLRWAWVQENGIEIIVVDDGSTDATANLGLCYARRFPLIRLLRNPSNCGKGYSVRRGFLEAQGEVVLFTDVDLSAPIGEAEKLLSAIRDGADMAIGSRAGTKSGIQIKRPRSRSLLGRLFRALSFLFLGLPHADTQCGFKAFRRERIRSLFEQQRIKGYAFDVELLFLARQQGLCVSEIGVHWQHDPDSKIHLLTDGGRMLWDLLRVRWWWMTGAYPKRGQKGPGDSATQANQEYSKNNHSQSHPIGNDESK